MEKVSAENKTFDFFAEKRHNLNDRKTPHKIFDCQGCLKVVNGKRLLQFFNKKSKQKNILFCA